jgi:hypothetical protein
MRNRRKSARPTGKRKTATTCLAYHTVQFVRAYRDVRTFVRIPRPPLRRRQAHGGAIIIIKGEKETPRREIRIIPSLVLDCSVGAVEVGMSTDLDGNVIFQVSYEFR